MTKLLDLNEYICSQDFLPLDSPKWLNVHCIACLENVIIHKALCDNSKTSSGPHRKTLIILFLINLTI